MRRYETIFITHPELSEEDLSALQEKIRSLMTSWKGEMVKLEDWGPKKLSYEIRKNTRGRFFLVEYLAATDLVKELERTFRLNDRILKFQTVRIPIQVTPEASKPPKEAGAAKADQAQERIAPSPEPMRGGAEKEAGEREEKQNEIAS